ncbi:MAG TPA: nuclear transport factor 2 family protein [Cyclobacteriaceae bacterium]|nr:nuclear transport factor 2 family protein [Cyclobacteriaceae bacterium]
MKNLLIILFLLASVQAFSQDTVAIHKLLDEWHLAAAKADANAYFGAIADHGIFIGTDASERWNKAQFLAFAKPYFDKGKAWDFKAYGRSVHVSNDGRFVWFSELLTTWMGVCRGSGVLEKTAGGWKIQQYHLSVTVPNDLIRDFITLVANFEKAEK